MWVLLFGAEVEPDGNVAKAISFNAALGIFLLSTAAILPYSGLGKRGKAIFRWSYCVMALYAYGAETIQNVRGVNPRFVIDGSAFDNAVAAGFAIVALLLVLFYLALAVQYFRRKSYEGRPVLVLGIRYAMAAVMLSFGAGISISINGGLYVGAEGNILWLHGLGFHALQALPILSWLAERTAYPASQRQLLLHAAGIAYLAALVMMAVQTYQGHSVFTWSLLPLLSASCFLITLTVGAVFLYDALRAGGLASREI
ncbi:hypothetical protein ACFO9Q_19955 [Paenibacillus sp. GCM10023252]|uniref:hypothetical protein n=1 Tax=Paenibacillus sp. GCM10023252 TaxID=3252649 RepID=UPI0036201C49